VPTAALGITGTVGPSSTVPTMPTVSPTTPSTSGARGRLRRETPVLHKLKNGTLIEGVIDLAFQEEESTFAGWTVVDFKTDREFDRSSERYVEQVRMYAEAVAAATATLVRGFMLVV
jgi:ATP-dependent helicase/nuclease subunit A